MVTSKVPPSFSCSSKAFRISFSDPAKCSHEGMTGKGVSPSKRACAGWTDMRSSGISRGGVLAMRLVIAGGGTGGHLFPGVAVAEEALARDPSSEVLFVGTARGIEARVVPQLGYRLELIDASGLKTVGALSALRGLVRVPRAIWQSGRLLAAFAPDAVLGVGGYASGPVLLAARLRGLR